MDERSVTCRDHSSESVFGTLTFATLRLSHCKVPTGEYVNTGESSSRQSNMDAKVSAFVREKRRCFDSQHQHANRLNTAEESSSRQANTLNTLAEEENLTSSNVRMVVLVDNNFAGTIAVPRTTKVFDGIIDELINGLSLC